MPVTIFSVHSLSTKIQYSPENQYILFINKRIITIFGQIQTNHHHETYLIYFICMMAMSALSYGQSNRVSFTFAWLSDVHLNSFAYAEDDLRQSIEDINANPAVDFTILSGDVTEFGDTKEFLLLQEILEGFRKPYLLLPGNHDVNWSENGCTMFNKIFQASHFCYDWQGVRFIGCGAGPSLRMGYPHIPREEILWLDSIVRVPLKNCRSFSSTISH